MRTHLLLLMMLPLAACELGLSNTTTPRDDVKDPTDSGDPGDSDPHDPGDSEPVDPDNLPPIADAGDDRVVGLDAVVELDGHSSYDPEGEDLTYAWEIHSMPSGSGVTLVNDSFVDPMFIPDRPGDYDIRLVVHDGAQPSAPDTVIITAESAGEAPVADAGDGQTVAIGDTVRLDGSGSYDPGGESLGYAWYFRLIPSGSSAAFSNPNAVSPTFVADLGGNYEIGLVVSDSTASSEPDTTIVIATVDGEDGGDDCGFGCAREVEIALKKRLGGTAMVIFPLLLGWRIRRRDDLLD
jgi:hypothetical protein